MRVVFTSIDALPLRHVGPEHTPVLARLAAEGGRAPGGVRSVLTSSTYPNHATFVTGTGPDRHGLLTNYVATDAGLSPAWTLGPGAPTLFDACRRAGRSSAVVVGDQHLVGVVGGHVADEHWPPDGEVPAGASLDAHGYLDDAVTIEAIVTALERGPDLCFAQLNAPDTTAHDEGPDSEAALATYRETDARLAAMRDALSACWDDTVWIVVSDHDQEAVTPEAMVDLNEIAWARDVEVFVVPEGGVGLACGDDPSRGAWLDGVDGVLAHESVAPGRRIVWAAPGAWFGMRGVADSFRGVHGGLRTRTQVGVVAGGHPAVGAIAASLARGVVTAEDWAPTVAALLDLDLQTDLAAPTGRTLVRP